MNAAEKKKLMRQTKEDLISQIVYDAGKLDFYFKESSRSLFKRGLIRWWDPFSERVKSKFRRSK